MPSRISAWGVYDVFTVQGGEQIFLAVVSDTQWAIFCEAFGLTELTADPRLTTNNDRVRARDWMMPMLRAHFGGHTAAETGRRVRASRTAVRADHQAPRPVRRPAPELRAAAWRRCA